MGEFLDIWLAGKMRLRASTSRAYAIHVERHIRPAIGHVRLGELSLSDLQHFYADLARPDGAGLASSSVQRVHATLSSALNTALRRGLIEVNPAAWVELPERVHRERTIWSLSQTQEFLAGIAGHELEPVFRLLLLCGLRRGEALGLRWCDVDIADRRIVVRQQVVQVGADLVINPPKSRRGLRTVSVDPVTAALLDERRRPSTRPEELVFQRAGLPLQPAQLSRRFELLVTELGLPRIRLHDLRHVSASLGLASGESLVEVSRRLGHSSVAITGDVYSHLDPALTRASADRLARLCTGDGQRPAAAGWESSVAVDGADR